jgi:hypothetical protein
MTWATLIYNLIYYLLYKLLRHILFSGRILHILFMVLNFMKLFEFDLCTDSLTVKE